ncbi:MAG: CBS domain-containing protein [Patescibacteria group bacterium]
MKVRDIMTKKVVFCEINTPVSEISKKLIKYDLTGMPVVRNKKVVGIVTEADVIMQKSKIHIPNYIQLLDSFLYLEDPKEVKEEIKKILGTKAEDIMTPSVITIDADAKIEDLASLFEQEHINPVPVVKNGKLVGIVSRADIVRLLARD